MKELLYCIPNKYFPGVMVSQPFHAKVTYQVVMGIVQVYDVSFSEDCLLYLRFTDRLVTAIKERINEVEGINLHPVMQNVFKPFITSL